MSEAQFHILLYVKGLRLIRGLGFIYDRLVILYYGDKLQAFFPEDPDQPHSRLLFIYT